MKETLTTNNQDQNYAVRFERVSGLQQFFVPFARIDGTDHVVEGYCFTEGRVPGDKWNLLPETLKRAAAAYMEMPCVRAMHQPIAAGKATAVHFDEDGRCRITAHIVDENEWKKVEAGVYRGFSLGGKPLLVRGSDIHDFDWQETSLVDRPADAGCRFTLVRAESAEDGEYVVRVEAAGDSDSIPQTPFMPEEELEVYGAAGAVDTYEPSPSLSQRERDLTGVPSPRLSQRERDLAGMPSLDLSRGEMDYTSGASAFPHTHSLPPLSRRMEAWVARMERRFDELDQLISASTSLVETRRGDAGPELPDSGFVARAEFETVELQRAELAARYEQSRQDLQRMARDTELLRGELASARAQIERLEKTPVTQNMPQRYAGFRPQAIERTFAVNEVLPAVGEEDGAITDLARLLREKNELMQRGAAGEASPEQRSQDATRLSAIDIELVHRFGIVPS